MQNIYSTDSGCDIALAFENLAWGMTDPFDGWYAMEKNLYDQGKVEAAGHYTNCMFEGDHVISGMGCSLYQDMPPTISLEMNDDSSESYTVEEYQSDLYNYMNKFPSYYKYYDVIDPSQYYFIPVYWADQRKITSGTGNGTFSPDASVTRGQMATFLYNMAGSPSVQYKGIFRDVKSGAYYAKAVEWAASQGIAMGVGYSMFEPDRNCTRAEIVSFLYRKAGYPAPARSGAFRDVSSSAYYADAVNWAAAEGITGGTAPGQFSPDATCTRAQAVTFLLNSAD